MPSQNDTLIELLSNHHRSPRGKAELACSILLEGAGREWRCRLFVAFTALDFLDLEILLCEILGQPACLHLTVQRQFFSVCMGDICRKGVLSLF